MERDKMIKNSILKKNSIYARQRRWYKYEDSGDVFFTDVFPFSVDMNGEIEGVNKNALKTIEMILCPKCYGYFSVAPEYSLTFKLEVFRSWLKRHECSGRIKNE
jgi:hypothetical protein